jgi:hypothetical protein
MSASEKIQIIIDATGEGAKRALHSVGDAFESGLGHKARAAGIAVGTAMVAAGAAMAAFTIKAVADTTEYAESIDKAAKTTGMATDELQKLKYAADQEHTSFEALNGGLKFLAKNMEAGKEGFAQMGIEVRNADGSLKGVGDVLPQVADYFKNCTNDTEKTALALQVFGKSGTDLIPFLEQGSAEIGRLGEEAEGLGIVMSGDSISAFEKYGDQVDKMKKSLQGVKITVAESVLPAFSDVTTGITDMFTSLTESGTLDQIFGTVGGVIADLLPTLETVFDLVGEVLGALAPVLSNVLGRLGEIFEKMADALIDSGMLDTIAEMTDLLAEMFLDVLEASLPLVTAGFGLLAGALDILQPVLAGVTGGVGALAGLIEAIPGWLTLVVGGVAALAVAFPGLLTVTGLAQVAVLGLGSAMTSLAAHPLIIGIGVAVGIGYLISQFMDLKGTVEDTKKTIDAFLAGFKTADEILPDYVFSVETIAGALERLGYETDNASLRMQGALTDIWTGAQAAAANLQPIPVLIAGAFSQTVPEFKTAGTNAILGYISSIAQQTGMGVTTAGDFANQVFTGLTSRDADARSAATVQMQGLLQILVDAGALNGGAAAEISNALAGGLSSQYQTIRSDLSSQINLMLGQLVDQEVMTQAEADRIGQKYKDGLTHYNPEIRQQYADLFMKIINDLVEHGTLSEDGAKQAAQMLKSGLTLTDEDQTEITQPLVELRAEMERIFSHPIYGRIIISTEGFGGVPERHSGGLILHAGGGIPIAHEGLLIGNRMKSDERLILAQTEEYMMQRSAVRKYGTGFMADVNAGRYQANDNRKSISQTIYQEIHNDVDMDRAFTQLAWRCLG